MCRRLGARGAVFGRKNRAALGRPSIHGQPFRLRSGQARAAATTFVFDGAPSARDYWDFFCRAMVNWGLQVAAGSSKESPVRSPSEAWKLRPRFR
jgi:hypothetical protein